MHYLGWFDEQKPQKFNGIIFVNFNDTKKPPHKEVVFAQVKCAAAASLSPQTSASLSRKISPVQ